MKEYQAILSDLKKGNYAPLYFLEGEEGFFIDRISNYIEQHALDEANKAFDQMVVYGRDTDINTVLSMAREFPLGGERKVLIVKEAQHLRSLDLLETYLENMQPSTVLVFCYKYKKFDRRTSLAKALKKKAILFTSNKLRDYEIPDMVERYLKGKGRRINVRNAHLIAEHLGNDLGRIVNELDKLLLITKPEQEVDGDLIEENIGISKDYNVFELQKALGARNAERSFMIARHFGQNKKEHPLVYTVSVLYSYFNKLLAYHYLPDRSQGAVAKRLKMNPFFVKETAIAARNYSRSQLVRIHSLMREYDMKSKGMGSGSATEGDLLRELIYKVLN